MNLPFELFTAPLNTSAASMFISANPDSQYGFKGEAGETTTCDGPDMFLIPHQRLPGGVETGLPLDIHYIDRAAAWSLVGK